MEEGFKLRPFTVVIAIIIGIAGYALGYANGHGQAASPSAKTAQQAKPTSAKALTPLLGNPLAKLTITEYADYQCPYCSLFNQTMMPQLKADFIDTGKVNFQFINAPLLGQESLDSAAAAYCANDQNKYWIYHEALYKITSEKNGDEQHPVLNAGIFSSDNLKQYAANAGLDKQQFGQCVDSHKYQGRVASEVIAANQAGVRGTPYFIIGNQSYSGLQPYNIMKSLIEAQL